MCVLHLELPAMAQVCFGGCVCTGSRWDVSTHWDVGTHRHQRPGGVGVTCRQGCLPTWLHQDPRVKAVREAGPIGNGSSPLLPSPPLHPSSREPADAFAAVPKFSLLSRVQRAPLVPGRFVQQVSMLSTSKQGSLASSGGLRPQTN